MTCRLRPTDAAVDDILQARLRADSQRRRHWRRLTVRVDDDDIPCLLCRHRSEIRRHDRGDERALTGDREHQQRRSGWRNEQPYKLVGVVARVDVWRGDSVRHATAPFGRRWARPDYGDNACSGHTFGLTRVRDAWATELLRER